MFGGQTGQPDTLGSCPFESIMPEEFVAAFEGVHVASLAWRTPEAPIDLLTLEVQADPNRDAIENCAGDFQVPVEIEITTRDQGLLASGLATLTGSATQLERASLYGLGERVTYDVSLVVVDGEVRISGAFYHGDPELPGGGDATFPNPNATQPAGGGG